MNVLTWIIFGLIVGAIAKLIMPGTQGGGWFTTIILGIVGAFIGGLIGNFLGWGDIENFNLKSLILAVVGSLIVLWIYGMTTKKN